FFTLSNFMGILQDNAALLATGIGVTMVLLVGQLDLSVGSIVLCSLSLGALCIKELNWDPYLCLFVMVIIGTVLGMINASLIIGLKLNALLVTMATQLAYKGLTFLFTNAAPVALPQIIKDIRIIKVFGFLPLHVVIVIMLAILVQVMLVYTVFGRKIMTVGSNPAKAKLIGISTDRINFSVFTLCGLFSGVGAAIMAINLGNATLSSGGGYEFLAVTTIVLGGTSLFGGQGSIIPGTLCGVIILGVLENGLSIIGLDPYYFKLLRGLIIFIAMYFDAMKNKQ
ncbi:MAG: ABC transporter permease, partial [Bacillota bacterium]